MGEFVGYLSFLLPLYGVAVVLTLATVRQAVDRQRLQSLYDELSAAHLEAGSQPNNGNGPPLPAISR